MRKNHPTIDEIKAKAIELYTKDYGRPPPNNEPCYETLKTTPSLDDNYWKKAREVLLGGVEMENVGIDSHTAESENIPLLRPGEAARLLAVSPKTLWRWWKEGKISAKQLPSRRLRYPKDEIDRILRK